MFSGCFLCGSKDHYARDCTNSDSAKSLTSAPTACLTLCGLRVVTKNSFQPLEEPEADSSNESRPPRLEVPGSEEDPPLRVLPKGIRDTPGPVGGTVALVRRPNRWSRKCETQRRRCRRTLKAAPTLEHDSEDEAPNLLSLIEVRADALNGLADDVPEWEEIDFMVDSGAGVTVITPDEVKAVQPQDPDHRRNYKMADGSMIQDKGVKTFKAQTDDEQWREMSARVTDVDQALLSVSQVVQRGKATVVFSPEGSYIQHPGGQMLPLELRDNVYHLKMWVPREQGKPFRGRT